MNIWAIADLHLAISLPEKTMEVFGAVWHDYHQKLAKYWTELVKDGDLVLIAGDITWARSLEQAQIDLDWLDTLPGTKVMIKGNHDSWWSSQDKMEAIRPKSIHFLYTEAYLWNDIAIAGSRLWDTPQYSFDEYILYQKNPQESKDLRSKEEKKKADEKVFKKELLRLEMSLQTIPKEANRKLVMTHYPPIGAELLPSEASSLLESYQVDTCVFGHLHSLKPNRLNFGEARGVKYVFCAADYLDFRPLKIL